MQRRKFIRQSGILSLGISVSSYIIGCTKKKKPNILVLGGGEDMDINIGSFIHTSGLLHVLENDFPESKIILWKKSKNGTTESLLKKYFPSVDIVCGFIDKECNIEGTQLNRAVDKSDILIQVSGAGVAVNYLQAWVKKVPQKPFGIFGVTIENISDSLFSLLNKAAFIFTRETASMDILYQARITCRNIEFVPDTAFRTNIFDDEKAIQFMHDNGIEAEKFICVIPRLRRTPYWEIFPDTSSYSQNKIEEFTALNNQWKESDHAKLREVIITWVRQTKQKVVLCPEMIYETELFDELLFNPLPDDVKAHIVKHDYWFADEAMSLYSRAKAMVSFECHSPVMSLACGRPAFYLRQPQDTIKGQMFRDLGLSDWIFEIEQTTGQVITEELMSVCEDYNHALHKVADAMTMVGKYYQKVVATVTKIMEE